MTKRAFPFDATLAERVLSFIQSGGYPWVVAAAAGLRGEAFLGWVELGEKKKAREPYRSFARQVRQAIAHGRLIAELAVHDKEPKYWLSHGPGRETAGNPGWTGEVRPADTQETATDSATQWQTLYAVILRALAEFPEARLAVAEALRNLPPRG